mgnify:CR=1 FL=1
MESIKTQEHAVGQEQACKNIETLFGGCFEDLKHMVADESFGMRSDDFESIAEKIYSSKDLPNQEELELVKEVALERNFYLSDADEDYHGLVKRTEEIMEEIE